VKNLKYIIMIVLLLGSVLLPLQVRAEFEVPASKETEQWKVELSAPTKDMGEKGKFEVYSLLVSNKGENVHNINVGVFRNEPGTSKMYGLAPQMESDLMGKGQTLRFINFPVKTGTDILEFVITWEDEPITLRDGKKAPGRTFKETIVFKP
jgi:hypothetical protein